MDGGARILPLPHLPPPHTTHTVNPLPHSTPLLLSTLPSPSHPLSNTPLSPSLSLSPPIIATHIGTEQHLLAGGVAHAQARHDRDDAARQHLNDCGGAWGAVSKHPTSAASRRHHLPPHHTCGRREKRRESATCRGGGTFFPNFGRAQIRRSISFGESANATAARAKVCGGRQFTIGVYT